MIKERLIWLTCWIFCFIFCVFGGTISEDWSRFVLITGGTKKGHIWMQKIAETVGEFLKVDWGRSRLITGGNIGGHYCSSQKDFWTKNKKTPCCIWSICILCVGLARRIMCRGEPPRSRTSVFIWHFAFISLFKVFALTTRCPTGFSFSIDFH